MLAIVTASEKFTTSTHIAIKTAALQSQGHWAITTATKQSSPVNCLLLTQDQQGVILVCTDPRATKVIDAHINLQRP